ncbi:MAG TPA: nucleotidyltransferase family protein [bacterium]
MSGTVSAIFLAAGYGTRLYPLTKHIPKALLPIGERVLLDEVLAALEDVPGLRRRVLVTNSRFAGQFRRWRDERGLDLEIIDDGTDGPDQRLGAIRDLELARTRSEADGDLLVLGTDNLFGWTLGEVVRRAQPHRPAPSVALWEAPASADATQFGVVTMDGAGRITAFVEKSPEPPSRSVALCLYYFPEAMLGRIREFLEQGGNPDAPGYFVEWLVRQEPVYGIPMSGAWYDIGTPEAYEDVQRAWRRPQGPRSGA